MASVIDLLDHFTSPANHKTTPSVPYVNYVRDTLDRDRTISDMLEGKDWHNNMIRAVGSFVASGWPDDAIQMVAVGWQLDGYTREETIKEVTTAIEGARAKGYGPAEQHFLSAPNSTSWPSAFAAFDARDIPRRRWIYCRHYLRGFVSVLASAGGIGKTSLQVVEALAIASGRPLLGETVHERTNVWLINLEDPLEEMQLRIVAAMQAHGVTKEEVGGRLFVDAGRDFQILFAEQGSKGLTVNGKLSELMICKIRENNIGAVFIDPFVGSHAVNENDNMAINAVVNEIRQVADATKSAIGLVHHVRKSNGQEADVDSVRGAGSLIGAARVARVINKISKQDAAKLGIDEETAKSVFRVENGKANLSPPAESSVWRVMRGEKLANGEWVGVAKSYKPPSIAAPSQTDQLKVQSAVIRAGESARCSESASEWVGYIIAKELGVDIGSGPKSNRNHSQEIERVKIRNLLKAMVKCLLLKIVETSDKRNARSVKIYVVGGSIEEAFDMDLSPNCAAPLTAYYAQKENENGKESYSRI